MGRILVNRQMARALANKNMATSIVSRKPARSLVSKPLRALTSRQYESFDKFVTDNFVDDTTMSARPNSIILDDEFTSKSNFANSESNYQRKARGVVERGALVGGGIYEEDYMYGDSDGSTSSQTGSSSSPNSGTGSGGGWVNTALSGLFGGFQSILGLQQQQTAMQYQATRPNTSPAVYVIIGILVLLVVVALLRK